MFSSTVQRDLMLGVLRKASTDAEWVERTYKSTIEAARQAQKAQ